MSDKDKVIKGLECCFKYETQAASGLVCEECPYNKDDHLGTCTSSVLKDALELLKEQEPEKTEYIWECPNCGSQLILKTSKVRKAIGLNIDECPVCGGKILYGKTD